MADTIDADKKWFDDLVRIAREINPDLPADLTGKTVTIRLSVAGRAAFAFVSHKKTIGL